MSHAVSPDTKSAGHKVKITGIMICEESGRDQEGIRNNGAVEYVADISQAKGGNGTFDVNNHVK